MFKIIKALSFSLQTIYPGLVLGSGYNHPAKPNSKDDFQLGFYFDHTSGLPVISGSTVKGILRSVFPKPMDKKEIIDGKLDYFQNSFQKLMPEQPKICRQSLDDLAGQIFNHGDIFYDAYISDIPSKNEIFAEDYITPHESPFAEPKPIRFLKIAPSVTFTFQFALNDSILNKAVFPIKSKLELFNQIILDFGLGAKTNVGYGQFKGIS